MQAWSKLPSDRGVALLRALQAYNQRVAACMPRGISGLRSMHSQRRSESQPFAVFARKAARSWKPALALLGCFRTPKYHIRDFEESLAQSGFMRGTTAQFTSIARHLMNLQQDPLSSDAGREMNGWKLQLGRQDPELGRTHLNFMDLQAALAAARY